VRYDVDERERFRKAHGLDGKFVVMYSGNHSPCHPLTTLLEAARLLEPRRDIAFCFVGGGRSGTVQRAIAPRTRAFRTLSPFAAGGSVGRRPARRRHG
jgi:hypothetical protein